MMKLLLVGLSVFICIQLDVAVASSVPCTEPMVSCLVDPCTYATCPAFPTATCRANYCGGCNTQFFMGGDEVTGLCNTTPVPPTTVGLMCPSPGLGLAGLCLEMCAGDDDCASGELCCSNGCGHACMRATPAQGPTTPAPCQLHACPVPLCLPGYVLTTLPGECCPTCQATPTAPPTALPTPDCRLILCDLPICPDNARPVTLPGQCCPSCPPPSTVPNCAAVSCLRPTCADNAQPVVPPGECCPVCPPTTVTPSTGSCTTSDGTLVADGDSIPASDGCNTCFCNAGSISCTEIGCPTSTAPPIDCALVRCAYPTCSDGATPITPTGQCCPVCPPPVGACSATVYPPGFTPICLVVVNRWTFDSQRGCVRIAYSPCGQPEEGYNVFPDQEACEATCVQAPTTTPAPIRPIPLYALLCPTPDSSVGGICTESCSSDQTCAEGLKCCSNGCGHSCTEPVRIPYYPIPQECPAPRLTDSCTLPLALIPCSDDSVCAGELCCQRGRCGRFCTEAVNSAQPCLALRQLLLPGQMEGQGGIPGAYVPTCQDAGTFAPTQFHGSTGFSWCVNIQTGYPTTSYFPRGVTAQCPTCRDSVTGMTYDIGQTFTAPDGCNTCVCLSGGVIGCTRRACPSPCSLPPSVGPCRAAIPAFYYDQESGSCRQFTYGGCGGNANKFQSVGDCLMRCSPSDRCLQGKEVGPCEALIPSYFFNSSSGMCERFNYGGCRGNDNRFTSGTECLQACSPDTSPNPCWSVPCAYPNCDADSEVVTDDQHCCPYCRRREPVCRNGQMQCSDGRCIPGEYVCDKLSDCPNGEDELNCPASCDFMCGDGQCIESSHVCDSILDCADHSDAENCSRGLTAVEYLRPSDIPLQCPNASNLPAVCGTRCTAEGNECRDGQLCCNSGCGRICMTGVSQQPLCRVLSRRSQQAGLIGAFQPACELDGSFSELQCHGSTGYCWCVDVQTGQPVTNGTRGGMSCTRCSTASGDSVAVGASFSSEDGCNTCKCTKEYGIICTALPCVTKTCRLGDLSIPHDRMYRDECSTCLCQSGSLKCNRTACASTGVDSVTVNMSFSGDHDLLISNRTEIIREIKRMLISGYAENLQLRQEQVKEIKLTKGSIVVTVTLQTANDSGANLTLLVNQLEDDYMSGVLAIRYNGLVLEPTGTFQSSQQMAPSSSSGLVWWHYLIISCAGLVLILSSITLVLIVVVVVAKKRPSSHVHHEALKDVSYNKETEVYIEDPLKT